ncbi:MAG: hypothetical protein IKQ36_02395 [Clostridia bacterium]|nr:hypothetical protein [Clostridia bacterium]
MKNFMRELKACRHSLPEMNAEYERLFGGYAENFARLPLTKGSEILEKCHAERDPAAAPDLPQRVIRRED